MFFDNRQENVFVNNIWLPHILEILFLFKDSHNVK